MIFEFYNDYLVLNSISILGDQKNLFTFFISKSINMP